MFKGIIFVLITLFVCVNIFSFNKKNFKESISINGVRSISIYSISSQITVIPEKREDIYVELESYSNGPKLYIEDGKEVVIESKKKNWFFLNLAARSPKLRVYVPQDYDKSLNIKSISGSVSATGFDIESLEINSTSGRVTISGVTSKTCYIKSTSGSVDIEKSQINNLETKLVSGRLDIYDFSGSISGKSISGSVKINMKELDGDILYNSTSGSFNLDIESTELNSELKLKSLSGRVSCDFPVTSSGELGKKKVNGVSGKPNYKIEVTTTSSSINIKKS